MKSRLLFILILFLSSFSFAINEDSLLKIWRNKNINDTLRISAVESLITNKYLLSNPDSSILLANKMYELAFKTHNIKKMANSLKLAGVGHYYMGNLEECQENFKKSISLFNSINRKMDAAKVLNNLASVYKLRGNYLESILSYQNAEKIFRQQSDDEKLQLVQFNIGTVYLLMEDYDKALDYTQNALSGFLNRNDDINIINALNNIGSIYYFQKKYKISKDFYEQSLSRAQKINNKQLLGNANLSLSEVLFDENEILKSKFHIDEAIKIFQEIKYKGELVKANILLGEIYFKQNKIDEAIEKLKYALQEALKSSDVKSIEEAAYELYKCFKHKRMAEQSLAYFELSKKYNDSIKNQEKTKSFFKNAISYEFEKKALADSITNAEHLKVKEAELEREKALKQRNRTISYGLGLIVILIVAFSFYLYNRVIIIRRQKNIIDIQKLKVDNAYHKLEIEKKLVESKNKEIMASISYAKRIQDTLLPKENLMTTFFKNFVLFYKPKDVVSGDFYWFKSFGDTAVIATVDCTGHGVPGGFMSMMGSLLLDKIIQDQDLEPSDILLQLNNNIVRILDQKDGGEIQDGMDLSICVVNKESKKMAFSGARNGIIMENKGEIKKFEADLIPVGGTYSKKSAKMERKYTNHQIEIDQNAWVYMYSDGFHDQLSSTKMVSFGMERFENLLKETSLTANDKNGFLENEFNDWKANFPQVDDLLIVGFQI